MNTKQSSRRGKLLNNVPYLLFAVLAVFLASCEKKDDTRELIIWQTEIDPDAVGVLEQIAKDFEVQKHNKVKIKLESVSWGATSSKLAVSLATDSPPDLCHLQPFMVGSMINKNLLLPMNDVIADIEKESGGKIYPGVKDLHLVDGQRYGIAYAIGVTGWSVRKDIANDLKLPMPKTWQEYIAFSKKLYEYDSKLCIVLPGGSPFFIDQLFGELLANNGGRLFDAVTSLPDLTDPKVVEVLQFFKDISPYVDPAWQTRTYQDQFNRLARGEAGSVPVTYVRAIKAIEAALPDGSAIAADPNVFALIEPPKGPSYTNQPVSTIDCEPFVIFKQASTRNVADGISNAVLAKEFLRFFYKKENYMKFVSKVPIHLTPIINTYANSDEYNNLQLVKNWKQWQTHSNNALKRQNGTRPILMPDPSKEARCHPYLLEFQAKKILSNAVTDVVTGKATPSEAALKAQERAELLAKSLGFEE